MKVHGPARVLQIYIGTSDTWHGQPLDKAIVEQAHKAGLAGASVMHGQAGYGAHSRVHTASLLDLAHDLPVKVEIVDRAERLEAFLQVLDEMLFEGLVVMIDCEAITYQRDPL